MRLFNGCAPLATALQNSVRQSELKVEQFARAHSRNFSQLLPGVHAFSSLQHLESMQALHVGLSLYSVPQSGPELVPPLLLAVPPVWAAPPVDGVPPVDAPPVDGVPPVDAPPEPAVPPEALASGSSSPPSPASGLEPPEPLAPPEVPT
jgi:hypothetical protein